MKRKDSLLFRVKNVDNGEEDASRSSREESSSVIGPLEEDGSNSAGVPKGKVVHRHDRSSSTASSLSFRFSF